MCIVNTRDFLSEKMNRPEKSSNPPPSFHRGNGYSGFTDDTSDNNFEKSDSSDSGNESSGVESEGNVNPRNHLQNQPNYAPTHVGNVSWKSFVKGITIEPMMFALIFAICLSSVVLQNLYIERICKISLGYSDNICENLQLPQNNATEKKIDAIASKYVTYKNLIEGGFPIIILLFLGPWTDIHGTKKPMIIPLFGYFFSALGYLIFSHIPSARPELLLISSIPIAIVGGIVTIIMSAFSFMSKCTNVETRSFRLAMLEASGFLAGPLGTLTGGLLDKFGGFTAVFATSATIFLASFIYGWIVIREKVPEIEGRERRNWFTDMFNVQAVRDMFSTVFLKRSGLKRRWLLLMLAIISLRIFALFGYAQNMYLYTRTKFHWDLKEFTEFSVSDSFISITGGYVMILVSMWIFKLPDAIIGIITTCGIMVSQIVFAFAVSSWMLYLGAALQIFAGLITIVLRSMISKTVAKEEIARVFTFLAFGEASMPLIAVPLYSYIFSSSIYTFPGAMFLLSGGVYLIILMSFIYLYFSMNNANHYVLIEESTETLA